MRKKNYFIFIRTPKVHIRAQVLLSRLPIRRHKRATFKRDYKAPSERVQSLHSR